MKTIRIILLCLALLCLIVSCDTGEGRLDNALCDAVHDSLSRNEMKNEIAEVDVQVEFFSPTSGSFYGKKDSAEIEFKEKSLEVTYRMLDLDHLYKALPLFESEDINSVPGYMPYFSPLNESLKLAVGLWRIEIVSQDKDGKNVYQGSKDVFVSPSVTRSKVSIEVSADGISQWGMLKIRTDESYDNISLHCKNMNTGEEYDYNFETFSGNVMGLGMKAGTYILTFIKKYTETDGGLYSRPKNTGITLLARVDNGLSTLVSGTIEDFRSLGEVYITLPTVLENGPYQAYDYFTFEELKTYAYSGDVFIGEYLDDIRMENALYFVPEDFAEENAPDNNVENGENTAAGGRENSFDGGNENNSDGGSENNPDGSGSAVSVMNCEPLSSLGKAEGQHLYAHRKKYRLDWDIGDDESVLIDGELSGTEGGGESTKSGVYYWNTKIKAPTVTKSGFELTGWDPSFTGRMPAEKVMYKPVWTPKTCTLVLDYNIPALGSAYSTADLRKINELPTSLQVTYDMPYDELPEPKLSEYVFKGWMLQGEAPEAIDSSSVVKISGDHIAKAVWEKRSYLVSYNYNIPADATGRKVENCSDKRVFFGERFTFPFTVYLFDNYTFDGWYTAESGGTRITEDTVAYPQESDSPYVLYAHWLRTYSVTIAVSCNNSPVGSYWGTWGTGKIEYLKTTLNGTEKTEISNSDVGRTIVYKGLKQGDKLKFTAKYSGSIDVYTLLWDYTLKNDVKAANFVFDCLMESDTFTITNDMQIKVEPNYFIFGRTVYYSNNYNQKYTMPYDNVTRYNRSSDTEYEESRAPKDSVRVSCNLKTTDFGNKTVYKNELTISYWKRTGTPTSSSKSYVTENIINYSPIFYLRVDSTDGDSVVKRAIKYKENGIMYTVNTLGTHYLM